MDGGGGGRLGDKKSTHFDGFLGWLVVVDHLRASDQAEVINRHQADGMGRGRMFTEKSKQTIS